MLEQLRERTAGGERSAGGEGTTDDEQSSSGEGAAGPTGRAGDRTVVLEASLFQLGRALFGGVLAFMALDNLRNLEDRIQYAEAKGAPAPERTVPASSAGLLAGGLGVTLWRLPRASAAAVAGFLVGTTPVMHDFWNVEDEERQQEIFHFLKNVALAGAALVLLQVGRERDRE